MSESLRSRSVPPEEPSAFLWRVLLFSQVILVGRMAWNQGRDLRFHLQYGYSPHTSCSPPNLIDTFAGFTAMVAGLFMTICMLGFPSRLRYLYLVVTMFSVFVAGHLIIEGFFDPPFLVSTPLMSVYAVLTLAASVLSYTTYARRFRDEVRDGGIGTGLIFLAAGLSISLSMINGFFFDLMALVIFFVGVVLMAAGIESIRRARHSDLRNG